MPFRKNGYDQSQMKTRRLIFLLFSAIILFSMTREWNAPVACARSILVGSAGVVDTPTH